MYITYFKGEKLFNIVNNFKEIQEFILYFINKREDVYKLHIFVGNFWYFDSFNPTIILSFIKTKFVIIFNAVLFQFILVIKTLKVWNHFFRLITFIINFIATPGLICFN